MKDYNSRKIPNRRLLQQRRKLLKQGTIKKFFFRTFRFLLFLSFVLITSILFNSLGNFIVHSSWLSLKDVRFEGCQHVTPQELMKLAGVKKGMNIFDLNLEKVAQRLKVNPWVKEVKINRVFPHRLQISIKERIPVALAYHKRLLLVDNDGILFKEVERDDDIDMPVITGLSSFKPTPHRIKEIFSLLDSAEKTGALPWDMVSEVHVENNDGLIVYTLQKAVPIRISFRDHREKLNLLAGIKEDLRKRQIEPKRIDLISPEIAHVKLGSSLKHGKRR